MNRHQYLVYTYLDFTFRFLVLIAYFICITWIYYLLYLILRDTLTEIKKKNHVWSIRERERRYHTTDYRLFVTRYHIYVASPFLSWK